MTVHVTQTEIDVWSRCKQNIARNNPVALALSKAHKMKIVSCGKTSLTEIAPRFLELPDSCGDFYWLVEKSLPLSPFSFDSPYV